MRWRHVLKISGKILAILLVCFFLMGGLIVFFYGKEIKQLVINEVNKHLDTKIHVEEFDFSVIRHFPLASIELKNVLVEEAVTGKAVDTLLCARRLSLLFRINDVFNKDVTVRKILVYNGKLNIRIDEKGHGNYRILKNTDSTQSSSSEVGIEKIGLSGVNLSYINKRYGQDYSMFANSAEISGLFGSEKLSFNTRADLLVYHLILQGENYMDHRKVVLRSGLDADLISETYKIPECKFTVENVKFNTSGLIARKGKDWSINLSIVSDETKIDGLQNILPEYFKAKFNDYKLKGIARLNASVKGLTGDKKTPSLYIDFDIKNGSIASGETTFDRINLSGNYSYDRDKKINAVSIPQLNAALSGHPIRGSLKVENLPEAFLTLNAESQLDLKEIKPMIHSDTLESLSGFLAMKISYAGKISEVKEIQKGKMEKVKASGTIEISNLNFNLKNNPLQFAGMNGNLILDDNDIAVRNFCGKVSSTDFCFNGTFKNFIPFLLIPGQPGEFRASVTSNEVDLDEILVNKAADSGKDTSYIMKFNPRLFCNLDVKLGELSFRKFKASGMRGHVILDKQVITSRDMQFNAMGGAIGMSATINASRRDSINMTCDANFTGVDITRLFYEMENFDQQTMTDKNVKGKFNADVQFFSSWSNDLTLNSRSVKSTAAITIENGELLNFGPIRQMSKFIHVPDLNTIRFSTLKNTISIADGKITIPKMDMNSSAINISGNGVHDFNNVIDYHISLLLSDVLGKKARENSEFGEIADDGLGKTKLFIHMNGTVENPRFSYDKKAAVEKVKEDIALEKQNLKGILKQEFGLFKADPAVEAPKPKKKQELQVDWEVQ